MDRLGRVIIRGCVCGTLWRLPLLKAAAAEVTLRAPFLELAYGAELYLALDDVKHHAVEPMRPALAMADLVILVGHTECTWYNHRFGLEGPDAQRARHWRDLIAARLTVLDACRGMPHRPLEVLTLLDHTTSIEPNIPCGLEVVRANMLLAGAPPALPHTFSQGDLPGFMRKIVGDQVPV